MDKVLLVNHAREFSGWGQAARDYALAMDSVGLDVVLRCIRPNKSAPQFKFTGKLKELEDKDAEGCNICIQHLLPHLMSYDGRFDKNIGLFVVETDNWYHSGWSEYLNTMDEVWVPNNFMLKTAEKNNIKVPVHLVPHACDISKYNKKYAPLDIEPIKNTYSFYFIGEHNRRKRISAIIQAYFLAFTKNDNVSLVLKINKAGVSPNFLNEEINKITDEIKRAYKLYQDDRYPNIVVIPAYMSNEDVCRLHNTCDCFVNASFGEAWSIPLFDAMGFGRACISTNFGGPSDFLEEYDNGILVNGEMGPVMGMHETFPQLNTGREEWMNVNIRQLAETMIDVYKNKSKTSNNSKQICQNFSYEKIGNLIKNLLTKPTKTV